MKLIFYFSFFFVISSTFSQNKGITTIKVKKVVEDTIDFYSFPFYEPAHYKLTKIMQGKGVTIRTLNGSPFEISVCTDSSENFVRDFGLKVNYGDTIYTNPWDSNDKDALRLLVSKSIGVLHLNKKSNTLVVSSIIFGKKNQGRLIYTKVFKVLKWTYFGIILKDITNIEFNRTFYFQRKVERY